MERQDFLTDTELVALAALVHASIAGCVAENDNRKVQGYAMAYDERAMVCTPEYEALKRELERRGVINL